MQDGGVDTVTTESRDSCKTSIWGDFSLWALSKSQNWPADHCGTSHFDKEMSFFQEFFAENHLFRTNYLGFY